MDKPKRAKDLTIEELKNLPTHRLLAIFRIIRKSCYAAWYPVSYGNERYTEEYKALQEKENAIRRILNTREHIPRKAKKRNRHKS